MPRILLLPGLIGMGPCTSTGTGIPISRTGLARHRRMLGWIGDIACVDAQEGEEAAAGGDGKTRGIGFTAIPVESCQFAR